jgi:hypothetical protein
MTPAQSHSNTLCESALACVRWLFFSCELKVTRSLKHCKLETLGGREALQLRLSARNTVHASAFYKTFFNPFLQLAWALTLGHQ